MVEKVSNVPPADGDNRVRPDATPSKSENMSTKQLLYQLESITTHNMFDQVQKAHEKREKENKKIENQQ